MKVKNKIEAQRKKLGKSLLKILEESELIKMEMETIPHERGTAQRSLKPKSGLYIVHDMSGFKAVYEKDGIKYNIRVDWY